MISYEEVLEIHGVPVNRSETVFTAENNYNGDTRGELEVYLPLMLLDDDEREAICSMQFADACDWMSLHKELADGKNPKFLWEEMFFSISDALEIVLPYTV